MPLPDLPSLAFTPEPVDVAWLLAATRDRNPIHVWPGSGFPGGLPIAQGTFAIGHVYARVALALGLNAVVAITSEVRRPHPVGERATVRFDHAGSGAILDSHARVPFQVVGADERTLSAGMIVLSVGRSR